MKTIMALFDTMAEAQEVKEDLIQDGVNASRIQIVNQETEKKFLAEKKKGFLDFLFKDLGATAEDRTYYGAGLGRGGALIIVDAADDEADLVRKDIELCGGKIQKSGAAPVTTAKAGDKVMPVIEEKVSIGKQGAITGGVRVFSRITSKPVEEKVTLREERVNVERRPVNRPVTAADAAFRDETVEVTETVEKPIVRKEARVVEEVIVGKDVTERTETIRDTVRRKDVQVEKLPAARAVGYDAFENDFRSHWQSSYAKSGIAFDQYAPAYRCGCDLASDSQFASSHWTTIEPEARTRFLSSNPGSAWERFKDSVRYAWDRARAKLRAA
ncbi:MAG: YsnF/AvaK domain-containing protein [Planctomycetota bacterium]